MQLPILRNKPSLLCVCEKNPNLMRAVLFLLLTFFSQAALQAQFGIHSGYAVHKAEGWQLRRGSDIQSEPPGNGYFIGIDYWFRLKNARVEFLPELNYTRLSTPIAAGSIETQSQWYSLFFHVNFYPFDFKGDCDCPTFSKQGNYLQKGFFLQLSPGVSYMENSIEGNRGGPVKSTSIAPSAGIAAGMDFGVSDLLTISPVAGFRFFPGSEWETLPSSAQDLNLDPLSEKSSVSRLHAGIRLGWRFNYK